MDQVMVAIGRLGWFARPPSPARFDTLACPCLLESVLKPQRRRCSLLAYPVWGLYSFLMKKMDAEKIKSRLEDGLNVQAEMTWSLPAPDDRVEWSLWTSAMDTSAAVSLGVPVALLYPLCACLCWVWMVVVYRRSCHVLLLLLLLLLQASPCSAPRNSNIPLPRLSLVSQSCPFLCPSPIDRSPLWHSDDGRYCCTVLWTTFPDRKRGGGGMSDVGSHIGHESFIVHDSDVCTIQPFKRDFKEVVKTLGKHAQFTPYYVVYNGNSYGCTGVSSNASAAGGGVTRVIPPFSRDLPPSPFHSPYRAARNTGRFQQRFSNVAQNFCLPQTTTLFERSQFCFSQVTDSCIKR